MKEYISKEPLEKFFSETRKRLKPEDYSAVEFHTRDNMLLNVEQIIHAWGASDVDKIVRCRNCMYGLKSTVCDMIVCLHTKGLIDPKLDSYCSYAHARKEQER